MYYPYLRGKRHELSALRRTASVLDPTKVRPIIEPVKTQTSVLERTISELNSNNQTPIVVVNPLEGQLTGSTAILNLLQSGNLNFLPCIAFSHQNMQSAINLATQFCDDNVDFATYFKDEPVTNVSAITSRAQVNAVFATQNTTSQFLASMPQLVKLQDCFAARGRNADYPLHPYNFTDAHLTYVNMPNAIGFGDYQIVGEQYTENGGPARAVALHITYVNTSFNDHMFIKHCVSTLDSGTTSNTANKFLQALNELMNFANQTPDIDQTTVGFVGLSNYHRTQHYPNLGPAKECSIMHHIESIGNYL
ncbi:TPA: sce7725 family protein [Vibrio parahaemolyticus]|nr:sce7725 family protein [Vibrio parahaemolyticus]EGR2187610.1 ATP-binding protein [Vibrio parahaemolyticus]ELB2058932.1 sce7725 family protein [Vibrio parahaemolyticus]MBE3879704.1 sce7725 family protein [Vibrio parahaemolyticus]MCR9647863.1 sce7725 family protein [Vibrio parahaemolyticus]MCR9801357.1 sce7725 family protein [Vibrio parahaemolyticus]